MKQKILTIIRNTSLGLDRHFRNTLCNEYIRSRDSSGTISRVYQKKDLWDDFHPKFVSRSNEKKKKNS